jgi:hypothetical protein
MNLVPGMVVRVNRYDSYPHNATLKISYQLAVVEHVSGKYGSVGIKWKTGPNAGETSTVMANTCEVVESVIDQLADIPDAGKVRLEPWSARDDVTSSGPPSE